MVKIENYNIIFNIKVTMPIHVFAGNDGRSPHNEGYVYHLIQLGGFKPKFANESDANFAGYSIIDQQPFRRGNYVLVIFVYDENRIYWEDEDPDWTNDIWHIYPTVQDALDVLAKHGENEHVPGIDIYDFDSFIRTELYFPDA